jgi:D-amino-acid oxidase
MENHLQTRQRKSEMKTSIAIIGSGVIGLMTGIRLLENGFDVTIFSREHEPNMASLGASAFWAPFKAYPEDKILKWSVDTLAFYKQLHATSPESSVRPLDFVSYEIDTHIPLWTKVIKDYAVLTSDLPSHCKIGYAATTLFVDTSIFIDYLRNWFTRLNGNFVIANFSKIADVDPQFKTIINCSGVWSHQLVPDKESFPIRGQYILTEKPEGIDKITFIMEDDNHYTLIVPRTNDCYIGGTTQEHDWNANPDESTTNRILSCAKKTFPQLANVAVKKVGVGFRPGRHEVRIEKEKLNDGRTVIHNYGHGGSGYTIGWGCAADVVSLAGTP